MISSIFSNKLLFPIVLLVINLMYTAYFIGMLFDGSISTFGGLFLLFSSFIGLISILYIKRKFGNRNSLMIQTLVFINWLLIIFPILALILIVLASAGV